MEVSRESTPFRNRPPARPAPGAGDSLGWKASQPPSPRGRRVTTGPDREGRDPQLSLSRPHAAGSSIFLSISFLRKTST